MKPYDLSALGENDSLLQSKCDKLWICYYSHILVFVLLCPYKPSLTEVLCDLHDYAVFLCWELNAVYIYI